VTAEDEGAASVPDPSTADPAELASPDEVAERIEQALFEVKRVIVGQDRMVERLMVCLLARGHCLVEGVPGLAKTLAIETLASAFGGTFARIQFTPDLIPSDLVGTRIYRPSTESFDIEWGPVFANFVLADEINRAAAKVQSALLEVMAEGHVSIAGITQHVPRPFLVLATQNPIESEGVYPLPEAQRDRFLMKVVVGYPTGGEEIEIVRRMGVDPPVASEVVSAAALVDLQHTTDRSYVDHAIIDYAVRLVMATRAPGEHGMEDLGAYLSFGASPRASLGLVAAGRALALIRGRNYVLPNDISDIAPEVLRHRLVLSYEALADGIEADEIVGRVVATVPAPKVAPRQFDTAVPLPIAPPGPVGGVGTGAPEGAEAPGEEQTA
jgi:MoxR-like ATPase